MPVHDWTRVDDGTFHDFHQAWITHIKEALNRGILPPGYYAMGEQVATRMQTDVLALRRRVVVRHGSGRQVVAVIEVVSPANKDRTAHVRYAQEMNRTKSRAT